MTSLKSVFKINHNCWQICSSDRFAYLIDAKDYYAAFAEAAKNAKYSIIILGWDFDRREPLFRDNAPGDDYPVQLGEFLETLVKRKKQLKVNILCWDFNMIYAMEREFLPPIWLQLLTHRRFQFRMDSSHPTGASQHQKIVVIDDKIAFTGGIDLSRWRWDTSEHLPDDTRRIDQNGKPYPPFHDTQLLVDGETARNLGKLARERWAFATGKKIALPPEDSAHDDPWPVSVYPVLKKIKVAISRTRPQYGDQAEVREIENLYVDMIAAAQKSIYIENQYFTSNTIMKALAGRLQEKKGPVVVLVLPLQTGGWLEQATMDQMRCRILNGLADADKFGRLRVYYPYQKGLQDSCISVHSKITVIDDTILRVGSANASNRSMGLDTECDLAIEAGDSNKTREIIAKFRNELLSEHLNVDLEKFESELYQNGSLIKAIQGLLTMEAKSLRKLEYSSGDTLTYLLPDNGILDPDEPVDSEYLLKNYYPALAKPLAKSRTYQFLLLLAVLIFFAALWRWGPLADWFSTDAITLWLDKIDNPVLRSVVAIMAFIAGSLLMLPLTVLILVVSLVFGPYEGFLYALIGSTISCAISFQAGQRMGMDLVKRLSGSRIHNISKKIADKGIVSVAILRMLPVAPFTIFNLVAGVSHLRFDQFMIGSIIGFIPGIFAISVFAKGLLDVLVNPSLQNIVIFVVIIGALIILSMYMKARLGSR